jgi:hypothetical protein
MGKRRKFRGDRRDVRVRQEKMDRELESLGVQIDNAADAGDAEKLHRLNDQCAGLLKTCEGSRAATVWYYRSNVQAALQHLDDPQSWKWRQPHGERQILYLRRAHAHAGFASLHRFVRAQVTTNLANNLNSLGRSVEAIAIYDDSLRHQPRFAMALGNRGLARMDFARALHDQGHAAIILLAAYDDLAAAASAEAVWDGSYPGIREQFIAKAAEIETVIDVTAARSLTDLEDHSLGRSKQERAYRQWALTHQLFLNPMNVLGCHRIAATDRFGLPSYRSPTNDPPQFIAWFNQLKQEYVAARLFLFEAEGGPADHFADRELMLVDTLDHPAFGLSLEKMRIAFRTAYSLLDKVAGFVNAYFQLGEKPERVTLRNVWLAKDRRSVRSDFAERPNLALRGLYWLALDIVGAEASDADAIAPGASELHRLRNALEHRCLVLREVDTDLPTGIVETTTVEAFRDHALTMIRLARAFLIYLSLAVGREEWARAETDRGLALPMTLPTYRRRRPPY